MRGRALVAVALLALAALPPAPSALAQGRDGDATRLIVEEMSADRAHQMAAEGKLVLLDIRPPESWSAGGVPEHAETVDFYDPMFYDIVDLLTEGDKSMPIGLICNTGVRTHHAAEELMKRGYARPVDIAEGIKGSSSGPGWIARGLPMQGN